MTFAVLVLVLPRQLECDSCIFTWEVIESIILGYDYALNHFPCERYKYHSSYLGRTRIASSGIRMSVMEEDKNS